MKLPDLPKPEKRDVVAVVVGTLLWTWIKFFHDAGAMLFFRIMDDTYRDGYLFGTYLNCIALPLGIAIGAFIAFRLQRHERIPSTHESLSEFIACITLTLLFYVSARFVQSYALTSALSFVAVSVGSVLLFRCLLLHLPLRRRTIVTLLVSCLAAERIAYSLIGTVFLNCPLYVAGLFHGSLIVAAAFLTKSTESNHPPIPERAITIVRHLPLPLFIHIACYGICFGIMHGMLGFSDFRETTAVSASYARAVLLELAPALALALLCARNVYQTELLWDRIRGAVFPMAILGYSLLIATSNISVSTLVIETADSVYSVLFALGCLMMCRDTGLPLALIASVGCFLRYFGYAFGVLVGYFFGVTGLLSLQASTTLLFMAVFMIFSLGTFWIGSNRSRKKWWGLRIEKTPEHYHREELEEKCNTLAYGRGLSPREEDILLLLAEGKRATQIKEECGLSIYTVRNHIQSIYRKLDVHSAQELERLVENAPTS